MKITEDVRRYAAQQGTTDEDTIQRGLEQKVKDFKESGAEVYRKSNIFTS
jgi:phosphomethylpyrimidine synthase